MKNIGRLFELSGMAFRLVPNYGGLLGDYCTTAHHIVHFVTVFIAFAFLNVHITGAGKNVLIPTGVVIALMSS